LKIIKEELGLNLPHKQLYLYLDVAMAEVRTSGLGLVTGGTVDPLRYHFDPVKMWFYVVSESFTCHGVSCVKQISMLLPYDRIQLQMCRKFRRKVETGLLPKTNKSE
jgi:hypothetical protein